jgi:DNA polymerase-3 subunit beta
MQAMKVTVLQSELAKLLGSSLRFVSTRAQLPILENLMLEARGARLMVKATNLETSFLSSVGAKVEKEGAIAVPARTMSDIVSNLTGEKVMIVVEKENLKLTCDSFRGRLVGMNTSDFPVLVESLGKGAVGLEGKVLVEGLSKVLFGVSKDETRPVLTGVLFSFDPEKPFLSLVASDGFRLSQKKVVLKKKVEEAAMILPRGVLGEIVRMVAEEKVAMEVKEAENQVVFGLGKTVLGTKVIEGEFPNFERIIPKETRVKVAVSKEELLNAVRLGAVFARDGSNVVKLVVASGGLRVLASSAKSGKQEMEIPGKVSGEGVEISYNYRFLEEFLGVVTGESVEMEFTDGASPGVFRDPKDPEFFHLIMPVRVQE